MFLLDGKLSISRFDVAWFSIQYAQNTAAYDAYATV